jgi:hypothetical protein
MFLMNIFYLYLYVPKFLKSFSFLNIINLLTFEAKKNKSNSNNKSKELKNLNSKSREYIEIDLKPELCSVNLF